MSFATYLLVPTGSEASFKQQFFRNPHARSYPFLPEEGNPDLLNHVPQSQSWQPIAIQLYGHPTLLDKKPAHTKPQNHKAALLWQQQQDDIAIFEQLISSLRELNIPFGFGVLDLGQKRGWQKSVSIAALPADYQEATFYWLTS